MNNNLDQLYSRVSRRLMPFLFLCFVAAYLDRVNVGFAKLQMQAALHFSDAVYGAGAGIFFIGYFLFEVPSNLLMTRTGARIWIARIMISWGLISSALMFTTSAASFYVLRFLLGVAEAGFFPGIILYLTYWYPARRHARMVAWFMSGVAVAGVVGGPLSGWIMKACAGLNGWAGWQWLFLLEGLPSVLLGVWTLFYLDDGIRGRHCHDQLARQPGRLCRALPGGGDPRRQRQYRQRHVPDRRQPGGCGAAGGGRAAQRSGALAL